jgi:exopolysaccharide biosynthesis polyprenyl glycosylphosphotransferase
MGPLQISERRLLLVLGDVVAGTGAMLAATWLRSSWDDPGNSPVAVWAAVLLAIQIVVIRATDAHHLGRASNAFSGSYDASRAWLVAISLYLAVPYWSAPLLSSRNLVAQVIVAGLVAHVIWRVGYATFARQPQQVMRYAILGGGPGAAAITRVIGETLGRDHDVVGYIDIQSSDDVQGVGANAEGDGMPARLGGPDALAPLIVARQISTLVVVAGRALAPEVQRHVIGAYEAGIRVVPMPDLYEDVTGRVPVSLAADFWATTLVGAGRDWDYRLASRARDVAVALIGLVVTAALVPFVAVAMRLHGPGPVFYSQTRLGRNGRPFTIWKFRSMVPDAEAEGGAQWAVPGDVRVPMVGKLLRATRLDEFPQFWNVLWGEMSVVGPRPERPELVNRLEEAVPFYRVRLAVLPGLTGWAQVRAPYAASEAETLVKFEHDLYYLRHQSLYLDLLIIMKTLAVVVRFRGR